MTSCLQFGKNHCQGSNNAKTEQSLFLTDLSLCSNYEYKASWKAAVTKNHKNVQFLFLSTFWNEICETCLKFLGYIFFKLLWRWVTIFLYFSISLNMFWAVSVFFTRTPETKSKSRAEGQFGGGGQSYPRICDHWWNCDLSFIVLACHHHHHCHNLHPTPHIKIKLLQTN